MLQLRPHPALRVREPTWEHRIRRARSAIAHVLVPHAALASAISSGRAHAVPCCVCICLCKLRECVSGRCSCVSGTWVQRRLSCGRAVLARGVSETQSAAPPALARARRGRRLLGGPAPRGAQRAACALAAADRRQREARYSCGMSPSPRLSRARCAWQFSSVQSRREPAADGGDPPEDVSRAGGRAPRALAAEPASLRSVPRARRGALTPAGAWPRKACSAAAVW